MTLIIEGNSGGERRCDARCHNATTPNCDCVCGGLYHGKKSGSADLVAAIRKHGEEMIGWMEAEGNDCKGLYAALHAPGELFFGDGEKQ